MLLIDLFLLRTWPYRHACESPRAGLYIGGFLIATGCLYGLLVAQFQRLLAATPAGAWAAQIPDAILYGGNVLSGVLIAVVVHLGITLVAWLMAKAIGGPGLLIVFYRTTAYLLALGWPALPRLAASAAGAGRDPDAPPLPLEASYLPLAILGLALFLAGLFQVYVLTQEKRTARAALAVGLFVLFAYAAIVVGPTITRLVAGA
jgi:hypothetical protein